MPKEHVSPRSSKGSPEGCEEAGVRHRQTWTPVQRTLASFRQGDSVAAVPDKAIADQTGLDLPANLSWKSRPLMSLASPARHGVAWALDAVD
jgi:hypothetical protein